MLAAGSAHDCLDLMAVMIGVTSEGYVRFVTTTLEGSAAEKEIDRAGSG